MITWPVTKARREYLNDRIDSLSETLDRLDNTKSDSRMQAIQNLFLRHGQEIREVERDMIAWLDKCDRFLTEHPDDADFALTEELWLRRLKQYEYLAEKLKAATDRWLEMDTTSGQAYRW